MALTPSFTISSPADWFATVGASNVGALTSLVGNQLHKDAVQLAGVGPSSYTTGQGTWMQNTNGNAWFALEANP
jgi:hypothetical protein